MLSMPLKGDKKFDETEVLERAMTLFWKQGYEATGTAQLIREMGIGRQSVYDTFGSKRDLFLRALRHYAQTNGRLLTSELEGGGNPVERLNRQFKVWGTFALHHEEGCLMVNTLAELASHDDEVQKILSDHNSGIEIRLRDTLLDAKAAGDLSEDLHARQTARALVALLSGLFLLSKSNPSAEIIDDVVTSAAAMVQ